MTLKEVIEKIAGSQSIIIQSTEGTELYKGYRGNYETVVNDDSEVTRLGFHKEIISANQVNKRPINMIYQDIWIKK